jgi:hypothetical protein
VPGSFYRLLWCNDTHDAHLICEISACGDGPEPGRSLRLCNPSNGARPRLIRGFDQEQVFAPRCTASA